MTIYETNIPSYPCKRGKVRDVYTIGEHELVIITTDRISAFDQVLPTPIPQRGKVLTKITEFWSDFLGINTHVISTDVFKMPKEFRDYEGSAMLVKRTTPHLFECVVRGYLSGSGWTDYKRTKAVCGINLPANLQENMCFPQPLFTPATKEETGHDINISEQKMASRLGAPLTEDLATRSKTIFQRAAKHAWSKGIIIADTKFEWGMINGGETILIDEFLTPDSSRFWDVKDYKLGGSPNSFDKQYVRNYLQDCGWDKESKPPELPEEVVKMTMKKYLEAFKRLTGKDL